VALYDAHTVHHLSGGAGERVETTAALEPAIERALATGGEGSLGAARRVRDAMRQFKEFVHIQEVKHARPGKLQVERRKKMPTATLGAFALTAREGRTREPLEILGEEVLVKLTNADSDGATAIFYQTVPPKAGRCCIATPARTNGSTFWMARSPSRLTVSEPFCRRAVPLSRSAGPHTRLKLRPWISEDAGHGDAWGGFNEFFEELSSLNRGLPEPDLVGTERLMNGYGMELLGALLS